MGLEIIPPLQDPILGIITLTDVDSNYYFTTSDTSIILTIGYAIGSDNIDNTIFKYRINNGSWAVYSYSNYQDSHTFTGLSLSESDIIEGRITVKVGATYFDYPRVPIISTVVEKRSISDIKLMRRDFEYILDTYGFNTHLIPVDIEEIDCPCFNEIFARPDPQCRDCNGTGMTGGYDRATVIKAILQEDVPYALHGDANIYTRIGLGNRGDAIMFIKYDNPIKLDDKLFYNNFRWKVMNRVSYCPIAGATIYFACEVTREFGLWDEAK